MTASAVSAILASKHRIAPVPKFPAIPRLSIVVPVTDDLAAFERTLISVLENCPPGGEILVPHDGNYQDPYQLCDEVRFVIASSGSLVDKFAAGADAARGRFVHLLAQGVQATPGWTDDAIECFERFECGSVAPVIRHRGDERIVAAGWCDGIDRLCKPARFGQAKLDSRSAPEVGAYLQASFWRRELLRSLHDGFTTREISEASYGFQQLSRQAGWKCSLAAESTLLCDSTELPWESTSAARGKNLRGIANLFTGGSWSKSMLASTASVFSHLLQPSMLAESVGQLFAPTVTKRLERQMHRREVAPCDAQGLVIRLPDATPGRSRRKAA